MWGVGGCFTPVSLYSIYSLDFTRGADRDATGQSPDPGDPTFPDSGFRFHLCV